MSLVYNPYLGRYAFSRTIPLLVFTFHVRDAVTGFPVAGAGCCLHSGSDGTGEGMCGYTDSNGVVSLDPSAGDFPFNPVSYTVYKAGYITVRRNGVPTTINVDLVPTTAQYWVTILAGVGGTVDPSGTFRVAANTHLTVTAYPNSGYILDYWFINDVKSGNTNPLGVTIDRDSFSIKAVFKLAETPPPPPDEEPWPYVRKVHLFDSVHLTSPWTKVWEQLTRTLMGVDLGVLLGGKMDYSMTYLKGNTIPKPTLGIIFNDTVLIREPVARQETKTGSIDLTGLIHGTNSVIIGVESTLGMWAECVFDIWVTLGYSEEPVIEPEVPPEWLEWLKKNWQWVAVGGVGLFGVYLLTRKGPPVFAPKIMIGERQG